MLNKTINCGKILLAISLAGLFLFGAINFEKKEVQAAEGDAIAVRVMANPNHYSALAWYQDKKFSGNPTPLKVDGYDAIQDGRTVYVNVANVSGKCTYTNITCTSNRDCPIFTFCRQNSFIYTNIYLISYNQDAKTETIAIFNSILSKWKFNTNLTDTGTCFNQPKKCQGTSTVCGADSDCSDKRLCVDEACLSDKDCSGGGFCSSLKGKITRDTNRLADVVSLKMQIENYSKRNGHFPLLSAGTYVTGKVISTWPSWNGEFATELGVAQSVDPINKLGDCGGSQYDPVTCWDDKAKKFAGPFSTPDGLPSNSRVYAYSTDAKGQNYTACAEMESGLFIGDVYGACLGSYSSAPLPVITCGSLTGIQGQPFSGFVSVTDAQNNPTDFHLENLPAGYTFKSSSDPHKIEIDADNASTGGIFKVVYKSDSGQVNQNCQINISSNAFIIYPVADQKVLIGRPLNFSVYAASSKKNYNGINFAFSYYGRPSGLSCNKINTTSDGRAKCDVSYTSYTVINSRDITITANVAGDTFTPQAFNLNVYNNPPVIQPINCSKTVRVNTSYPPSPPSPCKISATDPDGNSISSFQATPANPLPAGMNLNWNGNTATLSGTPTASGTFDILFTATDEYGATSVPVKFTLQVNTYCGDQKKESPNTEGKGGSGDSGYEDCDGLSGIPKPWESSVSKQYGCTRLTCISSREGWCGDDKIQTIFGEQCEPSTHIVPTPLLSSISHQYSCGGFGVSLKACQETGGYCGDDTLQGAFGELCEPTLYQKPTPTESRVNEQYSCGGPGIPQACKPGTGGWCGDGIRQNGFGEQCEVATHVKPAPAASSINYQYSCGNPETPQACMETGGYCGDRIINGGEECDGQVNAPCTTNYNAGLPAYCSGVQAAGIQSCKSNCQWDTCVVAPPSAEGGSSSECNSTSPQLTNYSCCEITSCTKDGCSCCGRPGGAAVLGGYSFVSALSPCDNGTESCKLIRSDTNPKNWIVSTNHTTAEYRCWR